MILRILFTLAILAGLAAAPSAQSFTWEPDGDWLRVHIDERMVERIERAVEHVADHVDRVASRLSHHLEHGLERSLDRMAERVEDRAERLAERIESRVRRHVESGLRRHAVGGAWHDHVAQGLFDDNPCDRDRWGDGDGYRHCEVRDARLPAGPLTVNAGRNGGIRVEGWDGNEIQIRAVIQTRGRDEARARGMAGAVQVQANGGQVTATGPDTADEEWWSVGYRIRVPRQNDLQLSARNGGITVANVTGAITFDTVNGGVQLSDLGGRVNGRTRNGGVKVTLGGNQWDGEGLDVETSNGGVTIAVPEAYNAQLETRTVNGGFRSELPLTLSGELSPRRGISTTLGAGGAPVRVRTTNGGVRIEQR
jgi:hypothetical protein